MTDIQDSIEEVRNYVNTMEKYNWGDRRNLEIFQAQFFDKHFRAVLDELDKHRWRKVEDELPEDEQPILFIEEDLGPKVGIYKDKLFCEFNDTGWHRDNVTHWKPITPPESQEESPCQA